MNQNNWTERTRLLLGDERVDAYHNSHVLVVGLGGVGGITAEMLVRAGIGRLTIVDADIIQPSNLNRQIVSTTSKLYQSKASVLHDRLKDINPDVQIEVIEEFLKDDNMVELIQRHAYDFVVDAIDSLSPKVHLIRLAKEYKLPIISSMGAGAKRNPALALRKRLRKLGISKDLPVVFSSELPDERAVIEISGEQCKRSTAGTISYMPAIFGIYLSAYVLEHIKR